MPKKSQKMPKIGLTGRPGIGKTTLLKKLAGKLRTQNTQIYGFYTQENKENNRRIGFDLVDFSGQLKPTALATETNKLPPITSKNLPTVSKYSVHVEDFEEFYQDIFEQIFSQNRTKNSNSDQNLAVSGKERRPNSR